MLIVKNLQKNYPKFNLDVSFSIEPNEIVGLIGRNGAGKSTTFNLILNLIKPDAGEIKIFNKDIKKLTIAEQQKIGASFPNSFINEALTINEISKILGNFYTNFDQVDFIQNCTKFDLPVSEAIKNFSTGMLAKLKVLAALASKPELLILDEPTSGLDVVVRQEILTLLQNYLDDNNRRSIILSSHIASDLEKICDKLILIDQGKVIFSETTDKLLNNYGILKISAQECEKLDQQFIINKSKTDYGYKLLTNQREFYLENYPTIAMEKASIDQIILLLTKETTL